jgi:hypothetical protein
LCFDLVLYPFADNSHVPKLAAGNPTILIISSTNHFHHIKSSPLYPQYIFDFINSPLDCWLHPH